MRILNKSQSESTKKVQVSITTDSNGCVRGREETLCQPAPSSVNSQQGELNPHLFYAGLTESSDLPL